MTTSTNASKASREVRSRRGAQIQGERAAQQDARPVGRAESGLSGAEPSLCQGGVMADFEEPGDNDVFKKIRQDFDAKGVAQSDQRSGTP
jgi:hypothetical protein